MVFMKEYKVYFKDSGEIWEFYPGQGLTRYWISRIVDNLKWFREYFPEFCDPHYSIVRICCDGRINLMIAVGPMDMVIVRYELDNETCTEFRREWAIPCRTI